MLKEITENQQIRQILRTSRQKGCQTIYLFLDFDGVINVPYPAGSRDAQEALKTGFETANKYCVSRLNRLCLDYHLSVVVSSSWRSCGLSYCQQYLLASGLDPAIVIAGSTKLCDDYNRPQEIVDWLLAHPAFRGFLILDDLAMPRLRRFEVRTDFRQGYTEELDLQARRILQQMAEN